MLSANKRLGQHFLTSQHFLTKITNVAKALNPTSILEIGPGKGYLTAHLAKITDTLLCIEKDIRFQEILQPYNVVFQDAMLFDIDQIGPECLLVSNLPYNISVHLILKFLSLQQVVMVQKEVADRILSKHNCKDYGKLSVLIQTFAKIQRQFNVPPAAFSPAPKVTSTVICLTPIQTSINLCQFTKMLDEFFLHRRKMMKQFVRPALLEHVDPTMRCGEVTVEQYQSIYRAVYEKTLWAK